MRIDDPVTMRAAVDGARREADRAVGDGAGGEAWLMEIERARREAWRCDATAPLDLGPALGGAEVDAARASVAGSAAGTVAARRSGTGDRPLRPYGLEPVAATSMAASGMPTGALGASGAGTSAAMPAGAGNGSPHARVDASANAPAANDEPASIGREPAARGGDPATAGRSMAREGAGQAPVIADIPDTHDAEGKAPSGSHGHGGEADAASVPVNGRSGASGAPSVDARGAAASGGEHASVRLHVERGADGLLNAWLGVDRGADAQAAAVVAHWRDDARRRGDTVGAIHINGQAIARGGDPARGGASPGPSDLPASTPAFFESNAGEH
jgi:hypothetical protein